MTLAGGGLCSPPSSLSPHPDMSYCYSMQVSFSFWECHSLHKHFSFFLLSWIGNKTMRSEEKKKKKTTDIQENVVYFGTRWIKCNADLLLMSVILWTLITCARHVSYVLDFSMKMNNMWASLCCYDSLRSSSKRFPKDFNNLAAAMCSYSVQGVLGR